MKLLPILLLATTSIAFAEMRTWTFEKTGKTMEAEVVGFSGESAVMKQPGGKTYNVPIAYLSEKDRQYLTEQRAKQWKTVEIAKLEGSVSAGRYKKCTVNAAGFEGPILIQLLPTSVEDILNKSNQQESDIADANAYVNNRGTELRRAEAQAADNNRSTGTTNYYVKAAAKVDLAEAAENLPKMQKSHADYLAQTKTARTVKIKNTGQVYEGLQVWECADPRKASQ